MNYVQYKYIGLCESSWITSSLVIGLNFVHLHLKLEFILYMFEGGSLKRAPFLMSWLCSQFVNTDFSTISILYILPYICVTIFKSEIWHWRVKICPILLDLSHRCSIPILSISWVQGVWYILSCHFKESTQTLASRYKQVTFVCFFNLRPETYPHP